MKPRLNETEEDFTLRRRAYMRDYMKRWHAAHPDYQMHQDTKYYAKNIEACRKRGREQWSRATPEKKAHVQQRNRVGHLRRKYNMTPEAKEKMYQEQRGLCYLCHRPLSSCLAAVIDHSHYTEIVRGLAHRVCNIRLGWIEKVWHDDPPTLRTMLAVAGIEALS